MRSGGERWEWLLHVNVGHGQKVRYYLTHMGGESAWLMPGIEAFDAVFRWHRALVSSKSLPSANLNVCDGLEDVALLS